MIENHNADEWRRRNVVIIPGADHSFMAGREWTEQFVPQLAAVLDGESNSNAPFLDQTEMLTGAKFVPAVKFEGGYADGGTGALLGNAHVKLTTPYMEGQIGGEAGVGYSQGGVMPARLFARTFFGGPDSHFAVGPGLEESADWLASNIPDSLTTSAWLAGRLNLFDFAHLELAAGTVLDGDRPNGDDLVFRAGLTALLR